MTRVKITLPDGTAIEIEWTPDRPEPDYIGVLPPSPFTYPKPEWLQPWPSHAVMPIWLVTPDSMTWC